MYKTSLLKTVSFWGHWKIIKYFTRLAIVVLFITVVSGCWKLDESYPCKLVPATRRTRNSGLPSRTLSSRMFAKSYPRRVVPPTGRTLKLVPYFNITSVKTGYDLEVKKSGYVLSRVRLCAGTT